MKMLSRSKPKSGTACIVHKWLTPLEISRSTAKKFGHAMVLGLVLSTACTSTKDLAQDADVCSDETWRSKVYVRSDRINPHSAKTNLIKGRIVDESGEPIIGATLILYGTDEGTVTDLDGYFEINRSVRKLKSKTILIGYLGREKLAMSLTDVRNKEIIIVLASMEDEFKIILTD